MVNYIELSKSAGPIGIFDSGYGGLTIYDEIQKLLPQYDYLYLGDNARTPYGTRSFDVVYEFTRQAVRHLFQQGCQLVILACNTESSSSRPDTLCTGQVISRSTRLIPPVISNARMAEAVQ